MENRAYAIATGIFVLVMTGLLFVAAFWIRGSTGGGVPIDLITKASVAGLTPGAVVRMRGVEVGAVQSIGFDDRDPRLVRVRATVDPRTRLMEGTFARLSTQGISGNEYVELDYPDNATRLLPTSDRAPARIPLRPSLLVQLSDSGDRLLRQVTATLERIDAVLSPDTVQHIDQLVLQLNSAAVQLTGLAHDLRPVAVRIGRVAAGADRVVQATQLAVSDADVLVTDLRTRVDALDTARDAGQAAVELERAFMDQTLPDVNALAERLSRNSDTLERLLRDLEDRPQSLVFGAPQAQPGPGERGFRAVKR